VNKSKKNKFGLLPETSKPFGYVADLTGRNLARVHRQIASEYVKCRCNHPSVVGAVLIGGTARGFSDEYSDIDVVIFYDGDGTGIATSGEQTWSGHDFDVTVVDYRYALKTLWTMTQRWSYLGAEVLCDTAGKIKRLLKKKITFPAEERKNIIVTSIIQLSWYGIGLKHGIWRGCNFRQIPRMWLHRGDVGSAHRRLTLATETLLDLLFAYNHALNPGEKWKLHVVHFLPWLPIHFRRRINQVILVKQITAQDFERRLKNFMLAYRAIMKRIQGDHLLPRDIYHHMLSHSGYYQKTSI